MQRRPLLQQLPPAARQLRHGKVPKVGLNVPLEPRLLASHAHPCLRCVFACLRTACLSSWCGRRSRSATCSWCFSTSRNTSQSECPLSSCVSLLVILLLPRCLTVLLLFSLSCEQAVAAQGDRGGLGFAAGGRRTVPCFLPPRPTLGLILLVLCVAVARFAPELLAQLAPAFAHTHPAKQKV